MIIMINLEEVLLKLIAELPTSEFDKALEKAGLDKLDKKVILDALSLRGV
jgi:hypothetical protein